MFRSVVPYGTQATMISVARLNGDEVLTNVLLSDLTTLGALQRRLVKQLHVGEVALRKGGVVFAHPNVMAEDVMSDGDLIHVIVRNRSPHAASDCAFVFVMQDGSVVIYMG